MYNNLRLANLTLIALNLVGFYIILSIGVQILPKISVNWSDTFVTNYNNVLLSLSYSFIAATLFYLLINYLPKTEKKKRFQPVVKRDIKKIHSLFINMINTMEPDSVKHENIPDYNKFENLMEGISTYKKYPPTKGLITEASYLKTFLYLKVETKEIISHIHLFKEYVPIEIISLLEDLNDSRFFKDVVLFNSLNKLGNENMKLFAEPFYDGFKIVKQLKDAAEKLYD
ncbi:hypothetical protein [Rhodohalobacter sp. 8-1]|uniref:hypothetical protein n=1 Tax=Rhodohalobacter sp. 8-1 TaxID=3131972 RepID=UPI0030ED41E9